MNENQVPENDLPEEILEEASEIPDIEEKKTFISFARSILDVLEPIIIAICAVFLIFMSGVRLCRVDGNSMLNTLHDGENLIVCNWFYQPKTGDIIVFHQTSEKDLRLNEPIVKRVIATEGQFVLIDAENATVYVSDDKEITAEDALIEPYAYLEFDRMLDSYNASGKLMEIPPNCVFVLGDNRNGSTDSRYDVIGFVDQRRILGKVILRVTPFKKFGSIG